MSLEKHTTSSTANTASAPKTEDVEKGQAPVGATNGSGGNAGGAGYGVLSFAPHTAEPSKVLTALAANQQNGLSEDEAAKRLGEYGPNRIKPPKKPSIFAITMRQIGNAMTVVLSE